MSEEEKPAEQILREFLEVRSSGNIPIDFLESRDVDIMIEHLDSLYPFDKYKIAFGYYAPQDLKGAAMCIRVYPQTSKKIIEEAHAETKRFAKEVLGKELGDKHIKIKHPLEKTY